MSEGNLISSIQNISISYTTKEHFENWSKTQDRHNGSSWTFDGTEPTEYYAIHNPTELPQIS